MPPVTEPLHQLVWRLGSQVAKNALVLLIMIDDCAVKEGYLHGKIHLYVISCHSTHLHVHFCCLCVKNEYILRKLRHFCLKHAEIHVWCCPGNSCGTEQAADSDRAWTETIISYLHMRMLCKFPAFSQILLASCEKDRTRQGTHAHGATICNYWQVNSVTKILNALWIIILLLCSVCWYQKLAEVTCPVAFLSSKM